MAVRALIFAVFMQRDFNAGLRTEHCGTGGDICRYVATISSALREKFMIYINILTYIVLYVTDKDQFKILRTEARL